MWTLGQRLSVSVCPRSCYEIACFMLSIPVASVAAHHFLFLNKKITRGSVHFPDGS